MKNDYTHISMLLDRTGSMQAIRDDTIGGFNSFLDSQKAAPGIATLTLVQFDSQDPYEVIHRFKPIRNVPPLTNETFVPRASTPLLDALGRGINDLGAELAALTEADRPEKVIFVVVTDGQENASREFTKDQVQQMNKVHTDVYKWQFVFLSSHLTAIGVAKELGITTDSTLQFGQSGAGIRIAMAALGDKAALFRRAPSSESLKFDEKDRQESARPDSK